MCYYFQLKILLHELSEGMLKVCNLPDDYMVQLQMSWLNVMKCKHGKCSVPCGICLDI